MTLLESGLRLSKDAAAELHVALEAAHVHAAIVADNEPLNAALPGVKARVGGDQAAPRLERACRRSQEAERQIVVEVMEDAYRHRDINRRQRVAGEVADIIADELAAAMMRAPRP